MQSLPSGTVTFVMTDIEGGSRMWERDPSAMQSALARHDELLEQAVSGNSGVVVKSKGKGDSIFAVFARPSDAIAAGLQAQLALGSEGWVSRVRTEQRGSPAGSRRSQVR